MACDLDLMKYCARRLIISPRSPCTHELLVCSPSPAHSSSNLSPTGYDAVMAAMAVMSLKRMPLSLTTCQLEAEAEAAPVKASFDRI